MRKTTGISIRTNAKEWLALVLGAQHGEERNERLIASLNEQKSERVIVENNSLEGLDDRGKDGSSRD